MDKNEFIGTLSKKLRELRVTDVDDIISEYEQHFAFKLQDGHTEEEIALRLGNPEDIARQFASPKGLRSASNTHFGWGHVVLTAIGLGITDILAVSLLLFLCAFVLICATASIASAVFGFSLMFNLSGFGFLPFMPYYCAIVFALALFALAVLAAVGTLYCALYVRQLLRAYCRWRTNVFAAARGKPQYPPLQMSPRIPPVANRRLRAVTLFALTAFAVTFITAFVISQISSGALGFWHKWKWFV